MVKQVRSSALIDHSASDGRKNTKNNIAK